MVTKVLVKKVLFFFILLFSASPVSSQDVGYYGLKSQYAFIENSYQWAGGVGIEGMFGRKFSVNFSALYGNAGPDQYYFYTGGGQALGVYLLKKGFENTGDLALALPLGLLSFVVPESAAYRISLSEELQLAIYLAPFGYEVIRDTFNRTSIERTSYELGLRMYLQVDDWIYLVPQIGMKGYYENRALGANFGLSILLKGKKNPEAD